MFQPRLPDGQFFLSHNQGYETQKGLRINTQAIILDWQHTFQTTSCYPNLTFLDGCSFQAIINCSS